MTRETTDSEMEEFAAFAEEFKAESDRAAVILGAAKLDILLHEILQGFLLPNASGRDELLDQESPLGTFSARIHATHRLGLIEADLARALHMIRKIRNSFAHESSGVSLKHGAHHDRIRELVQPLHEAEGFRWLIDTYFGGTQDSATDFRAAVAYVSLRLHGLFSAVRVIQQVRITDLVAPPKGSRRSSNVKAESNP